ncbi:hypothetical protein [Mycolicibacterium sp.]|uniref:hypothetical protein n=1 Tax=Mycolicibacterium sp. TaxID=2320850 RepID=UPI0037CAFF22
MVNSHGPGGVGRLLGALVGVVALGGLFATLLPAWSLTVSPNDYGSGSYDLDEAELELLSAGIKLHVGFYDWIASSAPAVAAVPMALAVVAAVALTTTLRGPDRTLWGVAAGFALSALVIVLATALRPASRREVTGPLAREFDAGTGPGSDLGVGVGPGLVVSGIVLLVVCALAGWQYFATRRTDVSGRL